MAIHTVQLLLLQFLNTQHVVQYVMSVLTEMSTD